jgi:hypothetical protein
MEPSNFNNRMSMTTDLTNNLFENERVWHGRFFRLKVIDGSNHKHKIVGAIAAFAVIAFYFIGLILTTLILTTTGTLLFIYYKRKDEKLIENAYSQLKFDESSNKILMKKACKEDNKIQIHFSLRELQDLAASEVNISTNDKNEVEFSLKIDHNEKCLDVFPRIYELSKCLFSIKLEDEFINIDTQFINCVTNVNNIEKPFNYEFSLK